MATDPASVRVLTISTPPLNVIGFDALEALTRELAEAENDPSVRFIIITGGPGNFSTGADVNIFKQLTGRDSAVETSRLFQDAFRKVEDSGKPVLALLAGKVLGSGVELAAACHFRICDPATRFAMPEVTLGINPGAGGTQRLPRLVGVRAALRMMLSGKSIGAQEALRLGLVDAVMEDGDPLDQARAFLHNAAASGARPARTRDRTDKISDAAENAAAIAEAEKSLEGIRPDIIAPAGILEAVRRGLDSFDEGLRLERESFADCVDTPATRNMIYLFFATRETAKVPGVTDKQLKPRPVAKAAVAGMGTMGTGIVQALVMADIPVVVRDESQEALDRGLEWIAKSFEGRVADGKMPKRAAKEKLGLITATTGWEGFESADLVIEAVFEDQELKVSLMRRLEETCPPEAVLATNTSTISLDRLAAGMRRPSRLVGLHFFNPAHRMPLLEVVRAERTSAETVAAALQFAKTIRKTPVVVKNREGFLVNRLFIPYLKEAFLLLEDGAEAASIDAAAVEFGFPMGPLALIDMAGLNMMPLVEKVMAPAFPRHAKLSEICRRLVEAGHLGQKTGSGVYKYERGDYTPRDSDFSKDIIAEVRAKKGTPRGAAPAREEIQDRLVLVMVNEAYYALEEGIALRPGDVDVAMVLGAGFPNWRGGVLKYAEDAGPDRVLEKLNQLEARHGGRFRPCALLLTLAQGPEGGKAADRTPS